MLILPCLQNTILFMLCTFAMVFARVKLENYAGGGTTSFVDSETDIVSLTTDSMLKCSIICTATTGCCTIRYEKSVNKCQLNFHCCPAVKEEGNGNNIVLQKIPFNENSKTDQPQDCGDFPDGSPPGLYTIYPGSGKELQVYCDNGWTVFQRRKDGSPSFVRSWEDYRTGFGDVKSDHWLGNDNIHLLTNNNKTCGRKLKIMLTDWNNEVREAVYNIFHIGDELSKYRLYARGGTGSLIELSTDYFGPLSNYAFSTPDQDNDVYDGQCAHMRQAGWWFSACGGCCLNGRIQNGGVQSWETMHWFGWLEALSLKTSLMLLK